MFDTVSRITGLQSLSHRSPVNDICRVKLIRKFVQIAWRGRIHFGEYSARDRKLLTFLVPTSP